VLTNVYLHYVLDMWFDKIIKKHSKGEAQIVRYADDFVCFFQYKEEAEKFYEALEARLNKFGLELSKEKSKIIRIGRFAKQDSEDGKTETFDFLGFTHINGETLNGKYRVMHKTSKKKLKAKKESVKAWLRENMHKKAADTIEKLNRKIAGHYAYYGISGNYQSLLKFYKFVVVAFYKSLTRRSQRQWITPKRYKMLLENFPIMKPKLYVNIW